MRAASDKLRDSFLQGAPPFFFVVCCGGSSEAPAEGGDAVIIMSIAGPGVRKRHREEGREGGRGSTGRRGGESATTRPAEDACCF